MAKRDEESGGPPDSNGEDPAVADPLAEHDIEALRTTQSEVRHVLDHQIQTFNDVDNKAAKTFRLNAILLGLLLTAASFTTQSETVDLGEFVTNWTVSGVALLVASFVLAILTYTTSNIETGVGPTDVERLIARRYSEKEWLILLLRSEAEWLRENDRRQTINGLVITASHACLVLAVAAISVGIVVRAGVL